MHFIHLVNDLPVTAKTLGDKYSIYVTNTSKLRGATRGIGAFVFYYSPKEVSGRSSAPRETWNTQLVMTGETPIELQPLSSDGAIEIELPDSSPCTGLMTADMERYIVAPTIRLDMSDGRNVAIMLLSPRKEPAKIDVEKTTLSIVRDKLNATVLITADDAVGCAGLISGQGFKTAHLVLTRRPSCSSIHHGFMEKIAETKGPGQISVTWKPISKDFEDTLAVFRPDSVKDSDLEQLADLIGADDDAFMGGDRPPFLIGDGNGTSYKLTLTLDRFLRRELSDETTITVN